MKVVVFSDAHGNQDMVERVLDFNPDADYVLSLGDSGLQQDFFLTHDIINVKGNIGKDPGDVYHTDITVEDVRIFITHGHKFKVQRSIDKLMKHGAQNGYDVVLYGHTHIAEATQLAGIWAINPGSCVSPRNLRPPSYAILLIEGKDIEITFKDVMTNQTLDI